MLYKSGQYAKLMSEVALTFARERDTIIDEKQLATDVQNVINLEKKIDKVRFITLFFHLALLSKLTYFLFIIKDIEHNVSNSKL